MQLLNQLPKTIIAIAAILGCIAFLFLTDPPRTVCKSQIDKFKQSQTGFLYPDKNKVLGVQPRAPIAVMREFCLKGNSAGACAELIYGVKNFIGELDLVDNQCKEEVGQINEVKSTIWGVMKLLIEIAWGETPPVNYYQKLGWLGPRELELFCHLKRVSQDYYGRNEYEKFRETSMGTMPGHENLNREQVWNLILFSVKCGV